MTADAPTRAHHAWPVTPALLDEIKHSPKSIRSAGTTFRFEHRPGRIGAHHYDIEVWIGSSRYALIEEYGGTQVGVYLGHNLAGAAILARSLDDVIALIRGRFPH